jgi:membrane-associated protein
MTHLAVINQLQSAGPLMIWAIVLTFVFAECAFLVGMFLPGDSMLLAAGLLLAQHGRGELDAWALSAATILVGVVGNQVGYAIGAQTGTRLLARRGGRVLNRRNVQRAQRFFVHFGFWAVVVARWVPWLRTLAPTLAGAACMARRKFLVASVTGAIAWVPILVLGGYYGAELLDTWPWLRTALAIAGVLLFAAGTAIGVHRYLQEIRQPVDAPAPARDREQATGLVTAGRG